jgi:hypothetical protein
MVRIGQHEDQPILQEKDYFPPSDNWVANKIFFKRRGKKIFS